jgi:hypothetical protein
MKTLKTLEAFQKAHEGQTIRNIKYGYEIKCIEGKYLKGTNKYFDFNFMNLNDEWEIVEKKKFYNIRIYDKNDTLIKSYNEEIQESRVKEYIDKVLESYFGYKEYDTTYIQGKVVAEPIKTTSN